jgi:hypothetical protein
MIGGMTLAGLDHRPGQLLGGRVLMAAQTAFARRV